ncbi:hypothetical protein JCM10207_007385 [Rhodosporidiobolus poonsookiae]
MHPIKRPTLRGPLAPLTNRLPAQFDAPPTNAQLGQLLKTTKLARSMIEALPASDDDGDGGVYDLMACENRLPAQRAAVAQPLDNAAAPSWVDQFRADLLGDMRAMVDAQTSALTHKIDGALSVVNALRVDFDLLRVDATARLDDIKVQLAALATTDKAHNELQQATDARLVLFDTSIDTLRSSIDALRSRIDTFETGTFEERVADAEAASASMRRELQKLDRRLAQTVNHTSLSVGRSFVPVPYPDGGKPDFELASFEAINALSSAELSSELRKRQLDESGNRSVKRQRLRTDLTTPQ